MNYICILAHGAATNVETCIAECWRTIDDPQHYQIIVLGQDLDNIALERLIQIENKHVANKSFRFIASRQNLMAIGGRQRLFDMLRFQLRLNDIVIMLDDDVTPTMPGWSEILCSAASKYGIASQVAVDVRADWMDFEEPPEPADTPGFKDVAGGGMTAYAAHFLLRKNGPEYDQSFLPFWHADADLSLQFKLLGARVWWTGNIGLQHEFNHKEHGFYWKRNFLKLRNKWQGYQLIKAEVV